MSYNEDALPLVTMELFEPRNKERSVHHANQMAQLIINVDGGREAHELRTDTLSLDSWSLALWSRVPDGRILREPVHVDPGIFGRCYVPPRAGAGNWSLCD